MNDVVENEKLTIAWIACLLYSLANELSIIISGILVLIALVSLTATLIQSIKYHGTQKRNSVKKTRSRSRNV